MPNKFSSKYISLLQLTRLHAPTGYLLSFFPAAFGLMLAYERSTDLNYLPIFFIGSILARSAGCIINDLFDRNLDKSVERTKNRPIASEAITTIEAMLLLAILLCACLAILLYLSVTAIAVGLITIFLIILYPLMKRITYFPQAFLGITFNMGCLIGYATVKDAISPDSMILYVACGFWTMGYDTIYAFMDIKDDKKVGIKSTAILFEKRHFRLVIAVFYALFLTLLMFAFRNFLSAYVIFAVLASLPIIFWIIIYLDVNDPNNCLIRFKANNYIGFLLFLAMLLEKL